jgi:hypothetical protein
MCAQSTDFAPFFWKKLKAKKPSDVKEERKNREVSEGKGKAVMKYLSIEELLHIFPG